MTAALLRERFDSLAFFTSMNRFAIVLQVLKVRITTAALPRERYESLAFFTSIGPTPDGRIKPDIIAPGTTISAHQ